MGKGRAPCCDKSQVKRGPWSSAEDLRLMTYIQKYGHENWRTLPKQAGLLRCGKSCRLRWINYLRPDLKRGNFTKEEEDMIIKLHQTFGNKWSKIASKLPGRTDNEIKNVWNTHFKKRLALMNANVTPPNNSIDECHPSTSSSSNDSVSCGDTNTEMKLDHQCQNQATITKVSRMAEDKQYSSQKIKELSSSTISLDVSNVTSSSQGNVLEEVNQNRPLEFPQETDSDFWYKLNSLSNSMQSHDNNIVSLESVGEIGETFFEEIENKRWLHYLEIELGLDETPHGDEESLSGDVNNEPEIPSPNYVNSIEQETDMGMRYYELWPLL